METSCLTTGPSGSSDGSSSGGSSTGASAADVTGLSRVCSDLLSRLDEFRRRVDVVTDTVSQLHECCQLIDKVVVAITH